jgi:hypothetical protein
MKYQTFDRKKFNKKILIKKNSRNLIALYYVYSASIWRLLAKELMFASICLN